MNYCQNVGWLSSLQWEMWNRNTKATGWKSISTPKNLRLTGVPLSVGRFKRWITEEKETTSKSVFTFIDQLRCSASKNPKLWTELKNEGQD